MKYFNLKNTLTLLTIASLFIGCSTWVKNKEPGKEITLRLEPKQGNPRNSEGDFIRLKDGRILFIYTHFTGGSGDHASAYLAGRYSNDGGKTWTKKDVIILPNEGGMNIMSVSLLRLESGELALFYLQKKSESDCIPFMRISTDEAITWSEPIRCMDADGYHVVNNDRFVQLQNDRIIFPTALHKTVQSELEATGQIMCYYSDDNGKNWIKSQQIANPENVVLQEPGNIKSPLSPASIERIPATGDLLLVWNNNYEPVRDGGKRTSYNLAISKDEGETWQKIKTIESDPAGWYCYTAIEFANNHVLLGHCAGDTKVNSGLATTQITRLSLDWIYQDATSDPFVASDSGGVVKLACKEKNVQIRYTLDGTLPTQSTGLMYQNPIIVTRTMPLYMQAFQPGKTPSQVISASVGSDVYCPLQQISFEKGHGLIYQYFEGEVYESERIKGVSLIESGVSAKFSISKCRRTNNFAFVFEGYIKIPEDGAYTFYLNSNDGSVLYLDDHKLIDNDGPHGVYEQTASTSLRAGMHKIAVKYFQLGGSSQLDVLWEGPGFEKTEIPASVLFHIK